MVPWEIMELIGRRCWDISKVLSLTQNVLFPLNTTIMLLQNDKFFLKQQESLTFVSIHASLIASYERKGLGWDEQVHGRFHPSGRAFHLISLNCGQFPSPRKSFSVDKAGDLFLFLWSLAAYKLLCKANNCAWFLSRLRWHPWKEKVFLPWNFCKMFTFSLKS